MNIQAYISLAVVIAYIPVALILIFNRPWNSQQKLFAITLVPTFLWGLSNVIFRSELFPQEKLLVLRFVLCFFVWAAVQFHHFLTSFYQPKGFIPHFGYVLLALVVAITFMGYFAKGVSLVEGVAVPDYDMALIPIAIALFAVLGTDFYFLWRKFNRLSDAVKRNQILYLLASIILMTFFSSTAVTTIGKIYPLTHLGAVVNSGLLTYAVLRHRLLDLQIVFRRALGWIGLVTFGIATYGLLLILIHRIIGITPDERILVVTSLVAAVVFAVAYLLQGLFLTGAERFFHKTRYEYYQKLHAFLKNRLSGIFSLRELGNELLPLLVGSVQCKHAHLLLPNPVSGDFAIEISTSHQVNAHSLTIRKDSPILQWLRQENSYLSKEDLDIYAEFRGLWDEERKRLEALDIELLFPMISRGRLIAVLAIDRKRTGKYSVEDINLAESIASQVATSLEKEYLQEQLRKREQELSLFNRLTSVITSSLNIREVYDSFITELSQVIDVDWAGVALIEGEELCFEALATKVGSAWQPGQRIPLAGTGVEWAANHKKACMEPDLSKSRRFWTGERHLKQGIRSIMYLPLMVKNEAIGGLIIGSRKPNAYNPEQVLLLERLASHIAVPIENSRLYARAEQRARVDEITGLFNRRHFDEHLKQEIERHSRYSGMLSLILLDLDSFKAYNDKHGHMNGDKLLARIGQMLGRSIRSTDLAFRYGGDEFAILLPQSPGNDAFIVAERVRARIAHEMQTEQPKITASLGLASWPSDGITPDELLTAADRALYYAKQTGGDRTCMASRILPTLTETTIGGTVSEKEALSIIYALAAAIEAKDQYTYGHSKKVCSYAVALAEALGLPPERVAIISTAALLHDIGKIGIPDEILNKVGKLDAEAWELIQSHPKLSATIVGHVLSLVSCLPAIIHHHERWDGTGYPSGLKGEAIPIEARILAIADAFDAMSSPRPYRKALSYKKVLAELKQCAGTQFDPKLVEVFLPIALATTPTELVIGEDISKSERH